MNKVLVLLSLLLFTFWGKAQQRIINWQRSYGMFHWVV